MTKTTRNSRLSKLLEIPLPLLPPALPEAFEPARPSGRAMRSAPRPLLMICA